MVILEEERIRAHSYIATERLGVELSRAPLLSGLAGEIIALLAEAARQRVYAAAQVVLLEGDPCEDVLFVLRGIIRVRQLSLDGREYVLSYLGPGAVVNLVAALDGDPSPATADALTEVTLAQVPCERFTALMRAQPELAEAVARHLAGEVRRLNEAVKGLALFNVRSRLARFLLEHAEPAGRDRQERGSDQDGPPTPLRWTQDMIAAHIGTVRDVVGRVLRSFVSDGLVRREQGRLVIVDRIALEREAAGE